ncbi:hypothetical protein WG908_03085 [Sphingobium sp. AN641]|uniref:hypothetical protein n=1 Tax=Sphingobium sp. AN641 TaxID=3133443 RepID=UPI0030BE87B9
MSEHAALALMEAREDMEPLRQGELDGLCGLYAILNTVRLLAYPDRHLHPIQTRKLFKRGIEVLADRQELKIALAEGMQSGMWEMLCQALSFEIHSITGFRLRRRSVFASKIGVTPSGIAKAIRYHLDHGRPVLAVLGGKYNHWTVIAGYSRHRLHLFDSYGYCWINARSLTLDEHLTNRAHLLNVDTTIAVERVADEEN